MNRQQVHCYLILSRLNLIIYFQTFSNIYWFIFLNLVSSSKLYWKHAFLDIFICGVVILKVYKFLWIHITFWTVFTLFIKKCMQLFSLYTISFYLNTFKSVYYVLETFLRALKMLTHFTLVTPCELDTFIISYFTDEET